MTSGESDAPIAAKDARFRPRQMHPANKKMAKAPPLDATMIIIVLESTNDGDDGDDDDDDDEDKVALVGLAVG